jgi:hypothetical protein
VIPYSCDIWLFCLWVEKGRKEGKSAAETRATRTINKG